MLDLFSIFTKGGIVLWCFQSTGLSLTPAVNALIKTVILQVGRPVCVCEPKIAYCSTLLYQERTCSEFNHGNLTMRFKMDNEYELIFVVSNQ